MNFHVWCEVGIKMFVCFLYRYLVILAPFVENTFFVYWVALVVVKVGQGGGRRHLKPSETNDRILKC